VADTSSRPLRGVSNHWLHDAKGASYACISGNPSCICRAFNASISGNPTRPSSVARHPPRPIGPLLSPSRAQSSDISSTTFVKTTAATVAVSYRSLALRPAAPPPTTFFNHINSHGVRYGTVPAVPDPELFMPVPPTSTYVQKKHLAALGGKQLIRELPAMTCSNLLSIPSHAVFRNPKHKFIQQLDSNAILEDTPTPTSPVPEPS
jgi:hypothetical protein